MAINIITNPEKIEIKKWDYFINKHKNGNIFQTSRIYKLYKNSKNFIPVTFFAVDNNSNIVGVLCGYIHRIYKSRIGYFSSRTIIIGGPIIDNNNPEKILISEKLIQNLIQNFKKKSIYFEFRNLFDTEEYKIQYLKFNFKYIDHLNYIVKADNIDLIKKRLSSSKIRQINKSTKNGAKIIEPEDVRQIESFYFILKELYKTKVKKPLPEWSFFFNFYKLQNVGRYFLIKYNEEIIGGIMCPIFLNKFIYEWYICGLDNKYKNIYPSVLAR